MTDDDLLADLNAAAAVHTQRRLIGDAIADLAASPLDEAAADRMRAVLASPELRRARRVLHRLARSQQQVARRPRLHLVDVGAELDEGDVQDSSPALAGGAA